MFIFEVEEQRLLKARSLLTWGVRVGKRPWPGGCEHAPQGLPRQDTGVWSGGFSREHPARHCADRGSCPVEARDQELSPSQEALGVLCIHRLPDVACLGAVK